MSMSKQPTGSVTYVLGEGPLLSLANALQTAARVFEQDAANVAIDQRVRDQFARQAEEASAVAEALMEAKSAIILGALSHEILSGVYDA